MSKEVKIKAIGTYNGHSIKSNKSVDLKFIFAYDELVNVIKTVQLLNENTIIAVKIGKEKPKQLGMFMLQEIKISNDGETTLKFNSQMDYVEADNLNNLIGEILQIAFKAEIEKEEDEDSDDDEDD